MLPGVSPPPSRATTTADPAQPSPTDHRTQARAAALDIELLWLPEQVPELNAMDQLWRELKRLVAANRQYSWIDALAAAAGLWVLMLPPTEARRKAGLLSPHLWLKNL